MPYPKWFRERAEEMKKTEEEVRIELRRSERSGEETWR